LRAETNTISVEFTMRFEAIVVALSTVACRKTPLVVAMAMPVCNDQGQRILSLLRLILAFLTSSQW
jgi:hypothetical protein